MVVVIRKFVEERSWFQDEGRQNHSGQVHARAQLLQQNPHQTLVFIRDRFCLGGSTGLNKGRGNKTTTKKIKQASTHNVKGGN